ncbi:MAG TPA: DUF2403 domain-containing lipoprotein [Polyangiaceae bacterium]|nr:DUF2403 domain-containing lipoprotein [Polyangiaceae bacterium]
MTGVRQTRRWGAGAGGAALALLCALACGSGTDTGGNDNDGDGDASGVDDGSTPDGAGDGSDGTAGAPPALDEGLGEYPFTPSTVTRGGTMSFLDVGAAGWWPRRLDREAGDPACNYRDSAGQWSYCCQEEHHTESTRLAPFDEEMTLILKAVSLSQLAVYQPSSSNEGSNWQLVSSWDRRHSEANNFAFTNGQTTSSSFDGDLTKKDCNVYVAQSGSFDCGDGQDYYCPDDPGMLQLGYSGSKLIVFLGNMDFDDAAVEKCDGGAGGHPGPWVAFVASELVRDGARKWSDCNCYTRTPYVGDGCGEMNVFEVVMDNNEYSNRDFASTGVRSYQEGHVGGAVCGTGCSWDAFPEDVEVVDACGQQAYETGPELEMGGTTDGCPVWRRPRGDRYFFVLLDRDQRQIQVGVIHPQSIPDGATGLLPGLPARLDRSTIDGLLALRLPEGG